jgi:hypothetical protein
MLGELKCLKMAVVLEIFIRMVSIFTLELKINNKAMYSIVFVSAPKY